MAAKFDKPLELIVLNNFSNLSVFGENDGDRMVLNTPDLKERLMPGKGYEQSHGKVPAFAVFQLNDYLDKPSWHDTNNAYLAAAVHFEPTERNYWMQWGGLGSSDATVKIPKPKIEMMQMQAQKMVENAYLFMLYNAAGTEPDRFYGICRDFDARFLAGISRKNDDNIQIGNVKIDGLDSYVKGPQRPAQ
jgi:hypothetical protein